MIQLKIKKTNKDESSRLFKYLLVTMLSLYLVSGHISKHKHSEINLYLTQDIKKLQKLGEINNIKNRSLSTSAMEADPSKSMYPYLVTKKMNDELTKVDPDLKMAVEQAEEKVEEDRDKKEIEGGSDDDGRTNQNEGYDEFGKKYPRDWSQPLRHEGNKCNLLLMKMFKLEGRLWSRKKDALKICPGVAENCCTYMDELVILKLWDEYSKPHIVEYVNKIIYNYSKILSLHYRLANISVKEIDFHSYKSRTVIYERTICERRDEVAFLDFNKGLKGNIEALDIYYKADDTAQKNFNVLEKVIEGGIAKDVKKEEKGKAKDKAKKGKKGKKGRRLKKKKEIQDRLLEQVNEYHDWKGRVLTELRDNVRETIKNAGAMKEIIDKHEKSIVASDDIDKSSQEVKTSESLPKKEDHVEVVKEEKSEEKERKLNEDEKETKADQSTLGAPMKILMAGLKKSLDKIKENPEIKRIITKTEEMKQRVQDENMFKLTSKNAEKSLEEARKRVKRDDEQERSHLKLTKKETIGIRNINWLKSNFQKALTRPVQQIHKIFVTRRRKLKEINDKVAIRLAEMHTLLDQKGLVRSDYERILKKFPKMSDFNLWVYKQIREGKKDIEDMPEFIVYKEDKLNAFFNKTKKTLEDMLMMEKKFLSKQKNVPIDNDFLYKFMKTLNKKDIPEVKLPFYPKRDRALPELPKVPISKISCFSYPVSFPRKFLIFNPVKFEFCYKTVLKLRKFDAQVFSQYLSSVRSSIFQLVYLKKNIYCDLCDQPKQQYFDMENEMIYYEMGFCRTLVTEFSEYVKWKNIIFIEYLNQLFNYIKCFETDAHQTVFPFKTYVAHQQREIYFIRRCLQNLDTPEYFKYCHFICKQFSYTGFDNFFIGNIDFLRNIFVLLVSFLRKMKVQIPRNFIKEIVRGHGQFKISTAENDHDYSKYMSDSRIDNFDDLNFREPIPEFRKLRNSSMGLWGNKPKTQKRPAQHLLPIYAELENRTRNSSLHPVHGIVFEKVGKELKRVNSQTKKVENNPAKQPNETKRILEEKKDEDEIAYDAMKPTKDEEVKEIYDKIDTKINPANMQTLYIEGNGLHPIKTEGLSNFGYNIDELIPHHYSHIKLESLGANTLHAVVPLDSVAENHFNNDIDMKFVIKKDNEEDKDLVTQLYDKRERQRNKEIRRIDKEEKKELEYRLNPKVDYMTEITQNANDKFVESDGDKMAMPEIDILF